MNNLGAHVDIGEDLARAFLPLVHEIEATLQSEEQKLLMWAGLFAAFGGAAAASIGPAALEAVKQTTERLMASVLGQTTQ